MAPDRGIVVARLNSGAMSDPSRALLLIAHLDVVGVSRDKWTVDPFAAEIKDGYIWGRGTIDDKSMVAANLAAIIALKRGASGVAAMNAIGLEQSLRNSIRVSEFDRARRNAVSAFADLDLVFCLFSLTALAGRKKQIRFQPVLASVEIEVASAEREELSVIAAFDDAPSLDHEDLVGAPESSTGDARSQT